jgi:hypothetical protein
MEKAQNNRTGEKETQQYRTGRFYSVANKWYFSVRETKDLGPYLTKLEAEKQLENYISDIKHFDETKVKESYLSLI